MKVTSRTEQILCLLVLLLALVILALVAISPPGFLSVNAVYQGF